MGPAKKKVSSQKNTGRKRVVKEKKVLKKPTIIRIKLPSLQKKESDPTSENPKNPSTQRKIELANEVALTQLCKEPEIVESLSASPAVKKTIKKAPSKPKKVTDETPKVKTPRGRKSKKQIPETTVTEADPNTITVALTQLCKEAEIVESLSASPAVKKNIKKAPSKPKKVTDETPKVKTPRGRKSKKQIPETTVTEADPNTITDNTEETPKKNTKKKKTMPKTPKAKTLKPRAKSADITGPKKRGRPPVKNNTPIVTNKTRSLRSHSVVHTEEGGTEDPPKAPPAQHIESRTNSVTSNLSWTRDISTSSTTTCVTVSSHDFVRVDKRLPVVQLRHIDTVNSLHTEPTTPSSSDSESKSLSDSSKPDKEVEAQVHVNSARYLSEVIPDLSLSDTSDEEDTLELLRQMKINKQNLDRELDMLGPEFPCDDIENDFSDILNVLTLERELLKQFRCLGKILDGESSDNHPSETKNSKTENSSSQPTSGRSYENDNINENNDNYTAFGENTPEDEDALSLFAESFTDVESSRVNDDHDEYVPLPRNPALETFTYRPTKITGDDETEDNDDAEEERVSIVPDVPRAGTSSVEVNTVSNVQTIASSGSTDDDPIFIASIKKPLPALNSSVFKGVCFLNLISGCKNLVCRYRHEIPEADKIERRLAMISEDSFIQEYILVRAWPALRRKYGLFFVYECDKRELTNVLVEMGMDFVTKANFNSREDADLRVKALEVVLMHLNRVPLEVVSDLLRYTVHCAPFYHTLMKAIANTQNFSQFKAVFVKFSRFIIDANGSFDIDIVTKILERVCILPFEESLVRAMHLLIQNTDNRIYQNPMMKQFRVLLEQLDHHQLDDDPTTPGTASPCINDAGGDTSTLKHVPDVEQFADSRQDTTSADRQSTTTADRQSTTTADRQSTTTADNDHFPPIAAPTIIRTLHIKPKTSGGQFRGNMNVRRPMMRWGPSARFPRPHATRRQVSYRTPPPHTSQQQGVYRNPPPHISQQQVLYRTPPPHTTRRPVMYRTPPPHATQGQVGHRNPPPHATQGQVGHRNPPPYATQGQVVHRNPLPHITQGQVGHRNPPPYATQGQVVHRNPLPHITQGQVGHRNPPPYATQGQVVHRNPLPHITQGQVVHRNPPPHAAQGQVVHRNPPPQTTQGQVAYGTPPPLFTRHSPKF